MIRHHSALIFEQDEPRPAQRGCDFLAVMERGVVVAERRVETPYPDGRGVAELIADLAALQVRVDLTLFAYLESQFEQRAGVLAELRIQKYVEAASIGALQLWLVRRVIADAHVEKTVQRNTRRTSASSGIRAGELRQLLLDVLQTSLRLRLRLRLSLSLRHGFSDGCGRRRWLRRGGGCSLGFEFLHAGCELFDQLEAAIELLLERGDAIVARIGGICRGHEAMHAEHACGRGCERVKSARHRRLRQSP